MNINEPISNPKLVSAIEGLSNNNATQQKFFEELAQAKFINRDTNGEGVLKVGTTLIRVSTVMGIL